jgi:hypothetical protein
MNQMNLNKFNIYSVILIAKKIRWASTAIKSLPHLFSFDVGKEKNKFIET